MSSSWTELLCEKGMQRERRIIQNCLPSFSAHRNLHWISEHSVSWGTNLWFDVGKRWIIVIDTLRFMARFYAGISTTEPWSKWVLWNPLSLLKPTNFENWPLGSQNIYFKNILSHFCAHLWERPCRANIPNKCHKTTNHKFSIVNRKIVSKLTRHRSCSIQRGLTRLHFLLFMEHDNFNYYSRKEKTESN